MITMMLYCDRKITKEDYDEIMAANEKGYVPDSMLDRFFSVSEICGYGVYGARACKKGDEYVISYSTSDSCD